MKEGAGVTQRPRRPRVVAAPAAALALVPLGLAVALVTANVSAEVR